MKALIIIALALLSGCSWFHRKPGPPPPLPEIVVTGSPGDSTLFVDGIQQGGAAAQNDKPRVVDTTPGDHVVEVRHGETVLYREHLFIKSGEKRTVTVLSGSNRE